MRYHINTPDGNQQTQKFNEPLYNSLNYDFHPKS